jgi:NADPH:quinone reductase-like Zn-dependent oxidoreductase
MKAVVVHEPGGPEVLHVEERPIPQAHPGWTLLRVRAFGLNRSELITRAGGSGDAVRFPRVLGIECAGEVVDAPGSDLARGQRVLAAMGGMGRDYDGGYAQYALLPDSQVIPVSSTLEWSQLGAIPESFGTAWGTLEALGLSEGESLLVHGGSSSVGMAVTTLGRDRRLQVLATTRQESKRVALQVAGARHQLVLDGGELSQVVRSLRPEGVDGLCELVGPGAMVEALAALAPGGRACITGFLEGDWETARAAAEAERLGVRLRHFASSEINRDSYTSVLQEIVDAVQEGRYSVNLDRVFAMAEIADAHRYMEADRAAGKIVVVPPED